MSARDGQERSAFTSILDRLVASSEGVRAAALVDGEGECVDFASPVRAGTGLDPYDVKLAAAHWQIVVRRFREGALGAAVADHPLAVQLVVAADRRGYVLHALPDAYMLVVVCASGAEAFEFSPRAVRQAEVELSREAGWDLPRPSAPRWRRVFVSRRSEPGTLSITSTPGAPGEVFHLAARGEEPAGHGVRSYHLRDAATRPHLLVREPTGRWYLAPRTHS